MKQQMKIRFLVFGVVAGLAIGGFMARPHQVYAVYNPPTDHRGPVLTGALLLNPIESVTPHTYNPPTKP